MHTNINLLYQRNILTVVILNNFGLLSVQVDSILQHDVAFDGDNISVEKS